jgi:hypothetical protein
MARDNTTWGEERIANELLLKLGLWVSPRTVCKYLHWCLDHGGSRRVSSQRWKTFVRNHATAIVACDLCTVVTATFRLLYVFVVMEHATGRVLHINTPIPQRDGRCTSCVKRFRLTIPIASSSMIGIRSSHGTSTRACATWVSGC